MACTGQAILLAGPHIFRHYFGLKSIDKDGQKWYKKNDVARYMPIERIDTKRLKVECLDIMTNIEQLGRASFSMIGRIVTWT